MRPLALGKTVFALRHVQSGKCAKIEGNPASPANGARLVFSSTCNYLNQLFFLTASGSLKHFWSGKCVHPSGGSANPGDGTALVLWSGCDDARLKFQWTWGGSVQHASGGKCVHPLGGSGYPTEGTPLVLWSGCNDNRLSLSKLSYDLRGLDRTAILGTGVPVKASPCMSDPTPVGGLANFGYCSVFSFIENSKRGSTCNDGCDW